MIKISERTKNKVELFQRFKDSIGFDLKVAAPGIIQSVNYEKQTCTVQLAIREKLNFDGNLEWVEIPQLLDVPFFIYSGGGYCLTLPISKGDDCLVVFGDNCMDAWWQSGDVQNQIERRRHDLSDGFAIVGFRSQPQIVSEYSPTTTQLRNKSGTACIEIAGDTINIKASKINIDSGGNTIIDSKKFIPHTHGGVQSGGSSTGGVNG